MTIDGLGNWMKLLCFVSLFFFFSSDVIFAKYLTSIAVPMQRLHNSHGNTVAGMRIIDIELKIWRLKTVHMLTVFSLFEVRWLLPSWLRQLPVPSVPNVASFVAFLPIFSCLKIGSRTALTFHTPTVSPQWSKDFPTLDTNTSTCTKLVCVWGVCVCSALSWCRVVCSNVWDMYGDQG